MGPKIEAQIIPIEEEVIRIYDVITADKTRDRVMGIDGIRSLISRNQRSMALYAASFLVLGASGLTALSKRIIPSYAPDLTTYIPTNWPVAGPSLEFLSTNIVENPTAAGIVTLIAAYYFGKNALKHGFNSDAISEKLSILQKHPPHHRHLEDKHIDEEIIVEEHHHDEPPI